MKMLLIEWFNLYLEDLQGSHISQEMFCYCSLSLRHVQTQNKDSVSESKVIFTSSAGNQPIYQFADQYFLDFDFITQHSNYYIGFILA